MKKRMPSPRMIHLKTTIFREVRMMDGRTLQPILSMTPLMPSTMHKKMLLLLSMEPYYPEEDQVHNDKCNNHITIFYTTLDRKKHWQKVCEFWNGVFQINALCEKQLAFDTR